MVSNSNPWQRLHEQMTKIDECYFPSAPGEKIHSVTGFRRDRDWIEFNVELVLGKKQKRSSVNVKSIDQSIVVIDVLDGLEMLRLFDIIISINDIELKSVNEERAQCIVDAHQGNQRFINYSIRFIDPRKFKSDGK